MGGRVIEKSYVRAKTMIENFDDLGYFLNMTEDEFLNAEMQKGSKRVVIVGNTKNSENWRVRLDHFKRDALSHFNKTGMSSGEFIINQILSNNSISFEQEKVVYIKGNKHKFDFYIPEKRVFIEYDGEQHFNKRLHWGADSYSARKSKDKEKDLYCIENNYRLLRIPYTIKSVSEISKTISDYLNITLQETFIEYNNIIENVSKFYSNHDLKTTIKKFNINKTTVFKYYKKYYGHTKYKFSAKKPIKIEANNISNNSKLVFNSITEAARELNTTQSNISACLSGKRKSASGYTFKKFYQIKKEEIL